MKVQVTVSKNYYKATTVEIEVPDGMDDQDVWNYLDDMQNKRLELSDALADASLNEAGDLEIEHIDLPENLT